MSRGVPQSVPLPPPGFVAAGDLPENYVPRHSVQTPGPAAAPSASISGPIPIVRPSPDDPADACALVVRQVSIKVRTELSVTRAEHDAMARVLDGCGDVPLLSSDDVGWPEPVR